MSPLLARNRDVLAARWPACLAELESAPAPRTVAARGDGAAPSLQVDGVHLASTVDRGAEARLQALLVPRGSREAWVYGLGQGDLPRELLSRTELERLAVVLLAPAAERAVLERTDQSDWLADPRVELRPGSAERAVERPFAASPASLCLAAESAWPIRDRVALELSSPLLRKRADARGAELGARLAVNRAFVEADGDALGLAGSARGGRVWVAAAGPTLEQAYPRLSERPAGELLFAVDAALRPLLDHGIVPDVVVALDDHDTGIVRYFDGDLTPLAGSRLAYAPVVPTDVLRRWPGERLAFYPRGPALYAELRRAHPRAELFVSGSVLHPCVDLAVRALAADVILAGADFGFPGEQSHVAGAAYARERTGTAAWVVGGRGERLPTLPNLRGYLRDLEDWIAEQRGVRFLNASRDGARIAGTEYLEDVDG